MELHEALQMIKFDKRLLEWNIRQGIITREQVEELMKSIPDSTSHALELDIEADHGNSDFN